MISEFSSTDLKTDTLVIERPKTSEISPRLVELRKKIYDE